MIPMVIRSIVCQTEPRSRWPSGFGREDVHVSGEADRMFGSRCSELGSTRIYRGLLGCRDQTSDRGMKGGYDIWSQPWSC